MLLIINKMGFQGRSPKNFTNNFLISEFILNHHNKYHHILISQIFGGQPIRLVKEGHGPQAPMEATALTSYNSEQEIELVQYVWPCGLELLARISEWLLVGAFRRSHVFQHLIGQPDVLEQQKRNQRVRTRAWAILKVMSLQ